MPGSRLDPTERILDAASTVFAELGVHQTRMGHVAERAGYSRASLYRHFPTKEALVAAFATRELERATSRVVERVAGVRALGDRLIEAVASAVETVRCTPAIKPFLAPDASGVTMTLSVRTPELGPRLSLAMLTLVGDHDGTERLRPDLPPEELLEWMVRVILSLALAPGPARTPDELRAFVGRLVRPAFVTASGVDPT